MLSTFQSTLEHRHLLCLFHFLVCHYPKDGVPSGLTNMPFGHIVDMFASQVLLHDTCAFVWPLARPLRLGGAV